jgi:transcription initiation factor TFIIIB Brf1 subunit/transcription initiation factor TFIIB
MKQTNKPIHKQGHCPICNSKNLKYNRPTYNSEYVYFDFDCLDCGCLANEQLKAEFIGTLIFNDDFTETFVNVGDETIGETK